MTHLASLPLIGCSDVKHLSPPNQRRLCSNLKVSYNKYNPASTTCCATALLRVARSVLCGYCRLCADVLVSEIKIAPRPQVYRSDLHQNKPMHWLINCLM